MDFTILFLLAITSRIFVETASGNVVPEGMHISEILNLFQHCYIEVYQDSFPKDIKFTPESKVPLSIVKNTSAAKAFSFPGMHDTIPSAFGSHYLVKWSCIVLLSMASSFIQTCDVIRDHFSSRHPWITRKSVQWKELTSSAYFMHAHVVHVVERGANSLVFPLLCKSIGEIERILILIIQSTNMEAEYVYTQEATKVPPRDTI